MLIDSYWLRKDSHLKNFLAKKFSLFTVALTYPRCSINKKINISLNIIHFLVFQFFSFHVTRIFCS